MKKEERGKIDWLITIVPFALIISLFVLFVIIPEQSNDILGRIRFFLGDTFGSYYIMIGIVFFGVSIYLVCSKYGNIILGTQEEKPKYSFFSWGAMMFTCGLAADILFYSFSEWIMNAADPHILELGNIQEWAGVYPLFHWRKHTDGICGRLIDLLAVFALIAGTTTTFSIATPLMSEILVNVFHIQLDRTVMNLIILIITCFVYTYSLLRGFKGISFLAKTCIYMFFGILLYVLLFGGRTRYIIESGISSLGTMMQNFVSLATYTDPLRTSYFPQNWTIYYWAYWMVWCVAAPFFIGRISKGRSIRQVILGGYVFGAGSTMVSFIVLGNYSMGMQMFGIADYVTEYNQTGDLYHIIVNIIKTLPGAPIVLLAVVFTMIAFYATSFDSIALTASCYSYRKLEGEKQPHKGVQLMWCILLILFPIALLFAESPMSNLQSVSIIAAFPIGIVMLLIVISFFKDVVEYKKKLGSGL